MGFPFRQPKNFFKPLWLFAVFSPCFSCQNLDHKKKSFSTQNFYAYQKNIDFNKKRCRNTVSSNLQNSSSQVIDQNYFEIQADSAYLKGEEAFLEENHIEALKYFKTALLFAPDSFHLQKQIATIYEKEGLFAEALNRYKILSQQRKANEEFHKKITAIYILKDLNKKAIENHQHLLRQKPHNFSLHFEQALLFINQGEWTEASRALKQAEAKAFSPEEKIQVILSKSYIFAKLQKIPKSLKTMSELRGLQIRKEEFILKIAGFYKSLGQHSLAIGYLENFQKTQGLTKAISKSLLDHYIATAKWEKALQQIEQIQALGYSEDYHYFYMAMLLMEKQNYDRALIFLKDLIERDPKRGQYLYFLALAYEQKKEWPQALKTYNQVPASSPLFLAAKLQVAQVFEKMGKQKESFFLLTKLSFSESGIKSLQALLLYAESLWNSGHKEQALHVLTKGLAFNPSHPDLLFLRGFYLKESGQVDLALKDMNQILKKEENHKEALNFIASLYSEQKINLNKAEQMAQKALQLKPDSSYFLNTLGWILFQKGNSKSALYYLNKAFSKNNKNSHIAKRLGKVHLKLKNFEKSEYFFKKALKLEKDDKLFKQTKKTLVHKQAFMH